MILEAMYDGDVNSTFKENICLVAQEKKMMVAIFP